MQTADCGGLKTGAKPPPADPHRPAWQICGTSICSAFIFVALGLQRAAEARFSAFPGFLPRWHQKQEQI